MARKLTSTSVAEGRRFGADLITLHPWHGPVPGVYNYRSARLLKLNGTHRAFVYFPNGYGGEWTAIGVEHDNVRGLDGLHCRRAHIKGVEGMWEAASFVLTETERFPVEIEIVMRITAHKQAEKDREYSHTDTFGRKNPTSRYVANRDRTIREGLKRITIREAAEGHLEAMNTITTVGMSNRQSIAIAEACAQARERLAAIYDVEGETRRRRELEERVTNMKNGRGKNTLHTPDWWPLD